MPNAPFLAPERDSALRQGRAKASGGTIYYTVPGCIFTVGTSDVPDFDADYYSPFYVDAPIIIDQLAFYVTNATAAKSARIGFYAADSNWQPMGAPWADSGDVSIATTGVKTYTPATPIFVPRGRYLSVINNNDTTSAMTLGYYSGGFRTGLPTTLANGMVTYMKVIRSYAAFPTPGTSWTTVSSATSNGGRHFVVYRVSTP